MRLLITYPWFYPAYKAGGPVQSVKNTALAMADGNTDIYILCSDKELDGTPIDVERDKWVSYAKGIHVYYYSQSGSKEEIRGIIEALQPDVIFINGIYSLPYTIYPLLYAGAARKILSVRGMLHPGALSQKKLKKKIFLAAFKFRGLHKKVEYHATTDDEQQYVHAHFGKDKKAWVVPNLPNVMSYLPPFEKNRGCVKLVSVSLISPMKNILLVLRALQNTHANITYDIYGPVKDSKYWEECQTAITRMPANVKVAYKGEMLPHLVQHALKDSHYFVLPSKSENFGHAIYEALSSGRPVITSHNTPWNGLEEAGAGYNIDPEDTTYFTRMMDKLSEVDNDDYVLASANAKKYIEQQYNIDNIKERYREMFAIQHS
ncbi:MAG TPA: glycosyltransferase [Flavipsychrobacter sp.]